MDAKKALTINLKFDKGSARLLRRVSRLCYEVIERGDYSHIECKRIEWLLSQIVVGLFALAESGESPKYIFKAPDGIVPLKGDHD